MPELTDLQRIVVRFMARFTLEHGYPPSLKEIGIEIGVKSTNGVSDHLRRLEAKGMVVIPRIKRVARGTVLSADGWTEAGVAEQ